MFVKRWRRASRTALSGIAGRRRSRRRVSSRIVISPANVVVAEHLLRDDRIDLRELVAEEIQLAQAAVDGQALIDRQDLLSDPRAALARRTDRSRGCGP